MYPRSLGRIIGLTPAAKRRAPGRQHSAGILSFFIIALAASSQASSPFDRSAFSRIDFSDTCAKKQWTTAPDHTFELLLAPPDHGVCKATLEFYFPIDLTDASGIAFEVFSTQPGLFLRMGAQDSSDGPVVYGQSFPRLESEWREEGTRLRTLQKDWHPRQLNALHFKITSNRHVALGPSDRVVIRNIRFVRSLPVAAAIPATVNPETLNKEAPITEAPSPVPVPTITALPAPVPSTPRGPDRVGHPILIKALLILTGIAAWVMAWGSRGRRRRMLSPLYEINMRVWKTQRDAHGVIQIGGFKSVTLSDLKTIKQSGFNTLWFMGIWEVGAKVRDISRSYAPDFQGSPFAIYDYQISSDLGVEQDFRELIQRAHSLRLSVIVDFIPNHMGLDSAWLNDHPEYFIHQQLSAAETALPDDELKQLYPGFFPYRTPSYPQNGRRVPKTIMVAYGRDPYFYPWIDTAQLDYAHPGLRQRMIDVLCHWAKVADGVRCDMAMLVLKDQVKMHRHPEMGREEFDKLMPAEFWTEAMAAVKRVNPHFIFMAETYWSMEGDLQRMGFDYTYNKPLYEAICSAMHSGHAEGLMNFLRLLGSDFLQRSVHFLENHDEERAMNSLGADRQKPAAAILCTLPGIALVHQGQMEGRRERLPVQRVLPQHQEPANVDIQNFYQRLLKATARPVFREGRFHPLYSNNPSLVTYARVDNHTKVLVVVNTSEKKQAGSVFLMPGLRVHSGTPYRLNDLFFEFKETEDKAQPYYIYPGAQLINQGLYVELEPFDAHLFVLEPLGALQTTQKFIGSISQVLEAWPLNRVMRRGFGAAMTRSSDPPSHDALTRSSGGQARQ